MVSLKVDATITLPINVPEEVLKEFEQNDDESLECSKLYQYVQKYLLNNNISLDFINGIWSDDEEECYWRY